MSDLYSYLTNYSNTTKVKPIKKGKKLKQKRLKWGARQGKYTPKQQRNYNNKEDKLDKLLTLLISRTNAPTPPADLKRQQEIASDFTIAQTIQAEEVEAQVKAKGKSKMNEQTEEEEPLQRTGTERQIMSGRMEEYNTDYEQLEQGYKSLINTMYEDIGEDSIIRTEALDEIIAHKEDLSSRRNELRKELLDDIKQNPSDIGEWKAFIETSEVQTSNLLELDNTASQILFDNTRKAFNKKEELSADKLKTLELNQQLTQDLLTQSQNEIAKEKQMKVQLEKALEETLMEKERADFGEGQVRSILQERLDTEREEFDKGKEVLEKYLRGELKSSTTAVKEARQQVGLSDYWTTITSGPNPIYQTAPDRQSAMKKALAKREEDLKQEVDIPSFEKFKQSMPMGFSPPLPRAISSQGEEDSE